MRFLAHLGNLYCRVGTRLPGSNNRRRLRSQPGHATALLHGNISDVVHRSSLGPREVCGVEFRGAPIIFLALLFAKDLSSGTLFRELPIIVLLQQ